MRSMLLAAATLFVASCGNAPKASDKQPVTSDKQSAAPDTQQPVQKSDGLSVVQRGILIVGREEYNYRVQVVPPDGSLIEPDTFEGNMLWKIQNRCDDSIAASVQRGGITSTSGIVNAKFGCFKKALSANPVTHDYYTYLIPKAIRPRASYEECINRSPIPPPIPVPK